MRAFLTFVLSAALTSCAAVASAQAVAAKQAAKTAANAQSGRSAETDATQKEAVPAPAPARPAGPAAPATPADTTTAAAPPGSGFSYRPEGRRDPFVSLIRRGTTSTTATPGLRAAGLRGLGSGEVTLRGTVASQGGYVAILQGADSKTYIVRPGEHLADGTIRSITADAMVILQQINDQLSLEKQREVRKVLRQTEEARP